MAVIDVVKWDANPNLFAWKFPSDNLRLGTQLIVSETQEALLVSGGVYDGPFGGGRHTLETENIPLIGSLFSLPFGGQTPFTAEVWFVNRVSNLNIPWGTESPIQLQDPRFGVMVPVRSYGQYGIEIEDSKKFLMRLVGNVASFDRESLVAYFRGNLITQIKTEIAKTIIHLKMSVLEVGAMLAEVSQEMHSRLTPHFAAYGLVLREFNVHSINVPETDPAVTTLKTALAKRAHMEIVGFNYQQERQFDVLETAAGNEGGAAAPIMGAGIGLGAGLGIGAGVGSAMGGLASGLGSGIHSGGGAGPSAQGAAGLSEKIEVLRKLAELRDAGVLTNEEFEVEKKRIIGT